MSRYRTRHGPGPGGAARLPPILPDVDTAATPEQRPNPGMGKKSVSRTRLDAIDPALYASEMNPVVTPGRRVLESSFSAADAVDTPGRTVNQDHGRGQLEEEVHDEYGVMPRTRVLASIGVVKSYLVGSKAVNSAELARAPSQAKKAVLEGRPNGYESLFMNRFSVVAENAPAEEAPKEEEPVILSAKKLREMEEEEKRRQKEEKYQYRSCLMWGPTSLIRRHAIWVVENPWFDRISLLAILVNSAFIAAQDPLQADDSPRNKWIFDSEIYFTVLFTIEMIYKITAMGFVYHPYSYLRDRWNWLDCVIVISGWVTLVPALQTYNVSGLRAFRVLRPLKTIRGVKGMRVLVNSLLQSVPLLLDVVALWAFALFIFGILGIQLWAGTMQHRCFYRNSGTMVDNPDATPQTCSKLPGQGYQCPEDQRCEVSGFNPNMGLTSFDHIGASFLLIFQTITLEGWTDIMYWLQDASTAWVIIYFVITVFFGSFFIVNLALAVIYAKFSSISEAANPSENKEETKKDGDKKDDNTTVTNSQGGTRTVTGTPVGTATPVNTTGAADNVNSPPTIAITMAPAAAAPLGTAAVATKAPAGSKPGEADTADDGGSSLTSSPSSSSSSSSSSSALLASSSHEFADEGGEVIKPAAGNTRASDLDKSHSKAAMAFEPAPIARYTSMDDDEDGAFSLAELELGDPTGWDRFVEFLRVMCSSRPFVYSILGVIVLNTIGLAIEHHGMDPDLADALKVCNYVFTSIFILEMVIKITGLGLKDYVSDRFNVFDGLIVIISIMELIIGGTGSITVFRTFRLMRIFKIVRSWRNLRKLLEIILNSLPAVGNCSFVLLLFMFIYTILGMQLFGGSFGDTSLFPEKPRANFDTFLWAFVTVFQVLTGENWNEVLFNTMIATTWVAALYFVSLVLVGNYVLLNLFQAILLQNFKTTELDQIHEEPEETTVSNDFDAPMSDAMSDTLSDTRRNLETKKAPKKKRKQHISRALQRIRAATATSRTSQPLGSQSGTNSPFDSARFSTPQSPPVLMSTDNGVNTASPGHHRRQTSEISDLRVDGVQNATITHRRIIPTSSLVASRDERGAVGTPPQLMPLRPSPLGQPATLPALQPTSGHGGAGGGGSSSSGGSEAIQPIPTINVIQPHQRRETDHAFHPIAATSSAPTAAVQQEPQGSNGNADVNSNQAMSRAVVMAMSGGAGSGEGVDETPPAMRRVAPGPVRGIERHKPLPSPLSIPTRDRSESQMSEVQQEAENDYFRSQSEGQIQAVPPTTPLQETMRNDPLPLLHPVRNIANPRSLVSGLAGSEYEEGMSMAPDPALIVTEEEENAILLDNTEPLPDLHGNALRVWSPDSAFRHRLRAFVYHKHFETLIIILIFLSSLSLALEYPALDTTSTLGQVLRIADIAFTTLFALEALLKIMVLGFVAHEGAYLRKGWNVLDFFVVLVSIVSLSVSSDQFKFLRSLRALRPLRVVSRSPAMKLVVSSLMRSVPSIMNVLLICMLFWLIFGILAVQLFGGKMHFCTDPELTDKVSCEERARTGATVSVVNDGVAEQVPVQWRRHRTNFDNILWSMLSLFEIATLEGWPDIMYTAVDATGVDQGPERDHNPWAALFFVGFIVVGSFFMVNLFVGVVIDNFNLMKEEYSGSAFLTPEQREWVEAQKMMIRNRPRRTVDPPTTSGRTGRCRMVIFNITSSSYFEWFILTCIILNIIVMATRHYRQPSWAEDMQTYSNIIFTSIFVLELVLKTIALGPKQYIRDNWNKFDAFIVVTSVPSLFGVVGGGATLLRVFRILRIFKLIRSARGVRMLLLTLLYSLPTLWNVGSLVILLFFIFAVAGVSLFGKVKYGECLNRHANFETFPNAMLTLFRVSTGEAWNCLMYDCMVRGRDCEPEQDNCGTLFAWAYFTSFIILVSFMLINLFIAVILENFSALTDSDSSSLTPEHFEQYSQLWQKYDPAATHYIPSKDVYRFLIDLPPPLGVESNTNIRSVLSLTRKLEIPDHDGLVHYKDLLMALAKRTFGVDALPACEARARVAKAWPKQFPTLKQAKASPEFTVNELYAAMHVQAAWRGYVSRRKFARSLAAAKADIRLKNAREIEDHLRNLLSADAADRGSTSGATSVSSHALPPLVSHTQHKDRNERIPLRRSQSHRSSDHCDSGSVCSRDDSESVYSMYSGSEALGLEAAFARSQDQGLRMAAQAQSIASRDGSTGSERRYNPRTSNSGSGPSARRSRGLSQTSSQGHALSITNSHPMRGPGTLTVEVTPPRKVVGQRIMSASAASRNNRGTPRRFSLDNDDNNDEVWRARGDGGSGGLPRSHSDYGDDFGGMKTDFDGPPAIAAGLSRSNLDALDVPGGNTPGRREHARSMEHDHHQRRHRPGPGSQPDASQDRQQEPGQHHRYHRGGHRGSPRGQELGGDGTIFLSPAPPSAPHSPSSRSASMSKSPSASSLEIHGGGDRDDADVDDDVSTGVPRDQLVIDDDMPFATASGTPISAPGDGSDLIREGHGPPGSGSHRNHRGHHHHHQHHHHHNTRHHRRHRPEQRLGDNLGAGARADVSAASTAGSGEQQDTPSPLYVGSFKNPR